MQRIRKIAPQLLSLSLYLFRLNQTEKEKQGDLSLSLSLHLFCLNQTENEKWEKKERRGGGTWGNKIHVFYWEGKVRNTLMPTAGESSIGG